MRQDAKNAKEEEGLMSDAFLSLGALGSLAVLAHVLIVFPCAAVSSEGSKKSGDINEGRPEDKENKLHFFAPSRLHSLGCRRIARTVRPARFHYCLSPNSVTPSA